MGLAASDFDDKIHSFKYLTFGQFRYTVYMYLSSRDIGEFACIHIVHMVVFANIGIVEISGWDQPKLRE